MQILAATLTNFKAHQDGNFQFQPGTNAICGENGAGKTSIIEAIAWALFDFSNYDKKDDLIRSGCSSSQVTVTLSSAYDQRSYKVQRCTTKGYGIHDPQLGINLDIRKKEDVLAWLRQHLGVPAHTELSKLFAETIGIPQGTLTSDFLKTAEPRKKIFDPILRVEDYKQAYLKAQPLEAFAKAEVKQLENALDQCDLQLADWDSLRQQQQSSQKEIDQDKTQLASLQAQIQDLSVEQQALSQLAEQLQTVQSQGEQVRGQIEGQQTTVTLLATALSQSEQAARLCQQYAAGYAAYQAATADLANLDHDWQTLQDLQTQRQQQQQQIQQRQTRLISLETQLTSFAQAQTEIDRLQPQIANQVTLEQALTQQQEQLQQILALQTQTQTQQRQITPKQKQVDQLAAELALAPQLQAQVDGLPGLEQAKQRYQEQLSHLQAARQFQAELQELMDWGETQQQSQAQQVEAALASLQKLPTAAAKLVPQISQVLSASLTLNTDLLAALTDILNDLSAQVSEPQLQAHLAEVQTQLQAAQQANQRLAALESKRDQYEQLQIELSQLQAELEQAQTQITQTPILRHQIQQLQQQLAGLQDPRGQVQLRQRQLNDQAKIQQEYDRLHTQQAALVQNLTELEAKLAVYSDLPNRIQAQKQSLARHQVAYQTYLQNLNKAEELPQVQAQHAAAEAQLADLRQQREHLLQDWKALRKQVDPHQVAHVTASLDQLRSQFDQLSGSLPLKQQQLAELDQQLAQRQAIAEQRQQLEQEHAAKQRIYQFILDARTILNQSGPRITRFYLGQISFEADRLWRELLDRQDSSLEWTEDYEIRVQSQGHWRSFRSLSGGEQMCAALAVRLALLRVLAEIDVAFFDEPTTNMDKIRRRQLAQALGNLKSFKQLFVISHDDTFENMTENIIRIERQP